MLNCRFFQDLGLRQDIWSQRIDCTCSLACMINEFCSSVFGGLSLILMLSIIRVRTGIMTKIHVYGSVHSALAVVYVGNTRRIFCGIFSITFCGRTGLVSPYRMPLSWCNQHRSHDRLLKMTTAIANYDIPCVKTEMV